MTPRNSGVITMQKQKLWPQCKINFNFANIFITLLSLVSLVSAQEIKPKYWKILRTYPQGEFYAQLNLPVIEDTVTGWSLTLNFEKVKLTGLRGYVVTVKEVKANPEFDGRIFRLASKGFNGRLTRGQQLQIELRGYSEDFDELPADDKAPIIEFQGVTYDGAMSDLDDSMLMLEELGVNGLQEAIALDPSKFDLDIGQLKLLLEKSLYFLDAQRSGPVSKEERYKVFWRRDSALLDGSDVGIDLTGGFYIGGDHIKFNFAIAHMVTILSWSVKRHKDAYYYTQSANGEKALGSMYKILKWGADYIMKCHPDPEILVAQVGTPKVEHKEWMRAEEIDEKDLERKTIMLTKGIDAAQDIASEMAAALAAFSIVARGNATYYHMLLDKSKSLYSFALAKEGEYDTNNNMKSVQNHFKSLSALDEQVWAEIWIFVATGEQQYLESATKNIDKHRELKFEIPEEFTYDDKRPGIHAILSQYTKLYPDHENSDKIVKNFCKQFLPHGKHSVSDEGMPFIDNWNNLGLASGMAMICIYMAEVLEQTDQVMATNFYHMSRDVVAFAAGSSGRSYMVGYTNSKFGVYDSPKHVHHRSSSCPMLPAPCGWEVYDDAYPNRFPIIGAVVGGPGPNGIYEDLRSEYQNNQPDILTNAPFQAVVASLLKYELRRAQIPVRVNEKEFRGIFNREIIRADSNFCDQFINPCKNNGQCINTGSFGFTCNCAENYAGERCEVRTAPLKSWGNKWGNGGIIEIELPEEHPLYTKSWVLQVLKPDQNCKVEIIEVWNGCVDYQVSDPNKKLYFYQNSHHKPTEKLGMKFEGQGGQGAQSGCFDLEQWQVKIVHAAINNDGTYYQLKCPNRLPWTPVVKEEKSEAMQIVGQDELDNVFLDRITQIAKDTQDGKLGYWQRFDSVNLEWVGYDDEAAWLLVWLPANPNINNYSVTLKFPNFCHIKGVVALMSCVLESSVSLTFPTNGGVIDLMKHADYLDSPFYALKLYMDKSDPDKEQAFYNCLIMPDYAIQMNDFYSQLTPQECSPFVPRSGNFLNLDLANSDQPGDADIKFTGKSWGAMNKEMQINMKKVPEEPWGLAVYLPSNCRPTKIEVWHACWIEQNSDVPNGVIELEQIGWNLSKDYIGLSITIADGDTESLASCWIQEEWTLEFLIRQPDERQKYSLSPDSCPREFVDETVNDNFGYNTDHLKGDNMVSRLQSKEKKTVKQAIEIPLATMSGLYQARSANIPGIEGTEFAGMVVQAGYQAPEMQVAEITNSSVILEMGHMGDTSANGVMVQLVNEDSVLDLDYDYGNYDYDGYSDYYGGDYSSSYDSYSSGGGLGSSLDSLLAGLDGTLSLKQSLKLKTGMKREFMVESDVENVEIGDLTPGVQEDGALKLMRQKYKNPKIT